MKLEAVMENLQRQQAARLALEEKLRQAEKEKDIRSMVESQIHQQALAFRHYQAAVRGAFVANSSSGMSTTERQLALPHLDARRHSERADDSDMDDEEGTRGIDDNHRDTEGDDMENEGVLDDEDEDEDMEGALSHYQSRHPMHPGAGHSPKSTAAHLLSRAPPSFPAPRQSGSPGGLASQAQSQHHEWTYEEQFKQVRRHLFVSDGCEIGRAHV